MKQRLTYLLPRDTGLRREDISVGSDTLEFAAGAKAAKEWRLTLGLDELPAELRTLLEDCHELHIRWATQSQDDRVAPLVSRVSPGLHTFYTPRSTSVEVSLCDLLKNVAGEPHIKCHSVNQSFTRPQLISERFARAASHQYFTSAAPSHRIGDVFLSKFCALVSTKVDVLDACHERIRHMQGASYVDVDFDLITHAVTIAAYWPPEGSESAGSATSTVERVRKSRKTDRLEIGVLHNETPDELEELKLGGYLTVLGDDESPDPVLFSFPSRHHPLPSDDQATFRTSFQQPAGLHPKLDITFSRRNLVPPRNTCALHAYLTLPSDLFIDRYALSDRLTLASQNLVAMHALNGEDDLEAPVWTTKQWGSAALFELAHPVADKGASNSADDSWTATIPTHLRYLNGSSFANGDPKYASLEVPWPVVFWACEAEDGLKMSTNPFDRVNLGYDGLFGPKTMFYHIPRTPATRAVEPITVPVLDVASAEWVPAATLIVVAIGFSWVCGQLLRSSRAGKVLQKPKQS